MGKQGWGAFIRQSLPASILLPQGSIYESCLLDTLKLLGGWLPCSSPGPFLNHLVSRVLGLLRYPLTIFYRLTSLKKNLLPNASGLTNLT